MSRFITAQQTAFRKLLKKHRKWSRSTSLELRFNKEILGETTSFSNIDIQPLLAEWEEILDAVRILYEERIGGSFGRTPKVDTKPSRPQAPQLRKALSGLEKVVQSSSQAEFDTFFATLPLGEGGKTAVYWVHPENVVELQVLLLQHARSHAVRRPSTTGTPIGSLSRRGSYTATTPGRRNSTSPDQDTGLLIVDDQDRFVQQQSSTTLEKRESTVGVILQNATVSARWTQEDEAIIATRSGNGAVKETVVKRKHLAAALDPTSSIPASKAAVSIGHDSSSSTKQIEETRSWFADNQAFRPLATVASSRQRFTDIASDSNGFLLATLDKTISMRGSSRAELSSVDTVFSSSGSDMFPYAVLRIRQEGSLANNLLRVLDGSHLVERVRGFSLEYHVVWQCCQPENTPPPFWVSALQDQVMIRLTDWTRFLFLEKTSASCQKWWVSVEQHGSIRVLPPNPPHRTCLCRMHLNLAMVTPRQSRIALPLVESPLQISWKRPQ